MPCLYPRKNSPYWWLKPDDGPPRSTKLRRECHAETQKAYDLLAAERQKKQVRYSDPERWDVWVEPWIDGRYEESGKSRDRYRLRWRSIRAFMRTQKVEYPRQLTFNVVVKYLDWRRAGDAAHGVWPSSKNTAIGDVKFLSMICQRAIQLGFMPANPCLGLGLRKQKPEPKKEISNEHIQLIWRALENEPQWMRDCFAIGLHTGCRLRETAIPVSDADTERGFIHFPDTKGDKPFTVPMRDELRPLFERLKKENPEGRAVTFPAMPSKDWWRFFKRLKLPYSFHCLRVTFITRLARAGVPQHEAMRLVNHASSEIHRIYQRFQPEELRSALQKLSLPSLPTHGGSGSRDVPQSTH
jgi:integrase